jgi:dihydrofolate reductase
MGKIRVACYCLSLDGFGAGPRQSLAAPLGEGAEALHGWFVKTRSFRQTHGGDSEASNEIDEDFARTSMQGIGAWIMGRNMFGPVRGEWPDLTWRGWWGENPPYHCSVYVLTHHPREPLVMEGGNVFHFVTGGIHEALRLARDAAGDADIRIGGGAETIRQYLAAGLVDELHLAYAPVFLGQGESLLNGIDLRALGYRVDRHAAQPEVTHVVLTRGG